MPGQERTESATPRRREDVRRRGQVARSPELSAAVMLLGSLIVLRMFSGMLYGQFGRMMQGTLSLLAKPELTPLMVEDGSRSAMIWMAETIGPLLLALLAIGLVTNAGQVGLIISFVPLRPDFNRLNLAHGFQRLFSMRSLVELGKAFVRMALVGFIAYRIVANQIGQIITMTAMPLGAAVQLALSIMYNELLYCGLALFFLSALDYLYQRRQFEKSIKMTREEIREEFRQSEGSPQTRVRIRQQQRMLARRRMMQQVPKAAVVITNPTHFAVALEYDGTVNPAPRVLAKGQDFIAEQIKRVAGENDVPIVENKPLAQALFKACDIGDEIPLDLYQAVAEVLAFILVLKRRRIALPPTPGTERRESPEPTGPAQADLMEPSYGF